MTYTMTCPTNRNVADLTAPRYKVLGSRDWQETMTYTVYDTKLGVTLGQRPYRTYAEAKLACILLCQ